MIPSGLPLPVGIHQLRAELMSTLTELANLKGEHKKVIAQNGRLIERLAASHHECQGLRERLRRHVGATSVHEIVDYPRLLSEALRVLGNLIESWELNMHELAFKELITSAREAHADLRGMSMEFIEPPPTDQAMDAIEVATREKILEGFGAPAEMLQAEPKSGFSELPTLGRRP